VTYLLLPTSIQDAKLCHSKTVAGLQGPCSQLPANLTLVNQTYVLPDPFRFVNNSPVRTATDWECRATQLRTLFQQYELGWKPPRPSVLRPVYANGTLNITAGSCGRNITFQVPVSLPSGTNSTGPAAPYPAIIAFDGLSIPRPAGVVVLTISTAQIAQQDSASSRGKGVFYDLYGVNATAGALMAYAWATSRIIDVIEDGAAADLHIDATRIAVTGCSRNGKAAMVAGAFDQRIALTIPQESGSGGDACWRVSRDMLVNDDLLTQTATEIVGENVWFSQAFDQFAADNYTIGLLPFDHHELAGLIAPRGLYSTENIGFLWLGDQSNYECMTAGNKIYQALGVSDHQGFSQDGPHNHCTFPSDQVDEINAFFDRFLFGQEGVNTNIFRTVGNWTYDPSWASWDVPMLA
jgi:hypothetical protein